MHSECVNGMCFPFLNDSVRKSFKRLPTTTEWGRFRKYARRMRVLTERGSLDALSWEVFSVLQPRTINDLLLPNLNTLSLSRIKESFIPFISLFLSPRIISIFLTFSVSDRLKPVVASIVTILPTLCPNLQEVSLPLLPKDPMITAAVSEMVLATNRNTLKKLDVGSPLTEEASEVVYKLPNLSNLSVVIERQTSLPSVTVSLPNLIELEIICDDESSWARLFYGETLGKLESVTFFPQSEGPGDLLGAFEMVVLSTSVRNTLSKFHVSTSRSWNPNYPSLLQFTQLVDLAIEFSCDNGCSSRVDDNIVISLSRAMPKLRSLKLGDRPCWKSTTGVTVKGLVALALHCPDLQHLRIHFQVTSFSASPASPVIPCNAESTSWTDCGLTELVVGEMPVLEELVLMVALTLLQIFPRIESIYFLDEGWRKVEDAIYLSKRIIGCSSKHPLTTS